MNKEIADKWIAALESGEFDQTSGFLMNENGYCCLGVLCQIAVEDGVIDPPVVRNIEGVSKHYTFNNCGQFLPDSVVGWAGMSSDSGEYGDSLSLVAANDVDGASFHAIAQIIRENVENL